MRHNRKYQIISSSASFKKDFMGDNLNCKNIHYSKSFFIKFYAYIPMIHTLKLADFSKQFSILDLGCADGPFLPTLNYYAEKTVGIDLDKESVSLAYNLIKDKCYKLKKVDLMISNGLFLPFKEGSFDLIFCLEVLEHVENTLQAIKEILRVLKNKGVLICSLPVEIGLSLLIRTLLGKILKFKRPQYNIKEIIKIVLLKKPGKREKFMDHKNFDWRPVKREIMNCFRISKSIFAPLNYLRNFNPIVIIKATK